MMELPDDWCEVVLSEGTNWGVSGIYQWEIQGQPRYVGKYTDAKRPLGEYRRNVTGLLQAKAYRRSNPEGFRAIHHALANAVRDGNSVRLVLLKNHPVGPGLNALERQYIAAIDPVLRLNGVKRVGRESEYTADEFSLPNFDLATFVQSTLAEDMGGPLNAGGRDVTSESVIPADAMFDGVMDSRDPVTVAGLPIAEAFFRALDPAVEIEILVGEGDIVAPGADLMRLKGRARAMLTAERSALNTVQHLTGIATLTRAYVDRIMGTGATLLDTRKTIPGLRVLEKYATRMGGAQNHRMGLWDAAMIKDNHVAVAGSVGEAVARAVAAGIGQVIVEVDRIDQIEPAIAAGATHLLLDNMTTSALRGAVTLVGKRIPTEASGGIRLENIREIAETGVDYISVGRLTQSAPAADIGLDFSNG